MELKIFTTSRQIRQWLQGKSDQFLPKHYTIGEFMQKIVVVKGKRFIDNTLRKYYLHRAIKDLDIASLGISQEFVEFFFDSEFIFSFFQELFLEQVSFDVLMQRDIYQDYEEHLAILKEIGRNYEAELAKDGYIDRFFIKEFHINEGLLEGVEKIDLRLDGYLSAFELEVLRRIERPIFIHFNVDRFNRSLIYKMFGLSLDDGEYRYELHTKRLQKIKRPFTINSVEVGFFSQRNHQVDFVFSKIAQFVQKGIEASKIAVIVPDEAFSDYLDLFDEHKNLNLAMGRSFKRSELFVLLESIYAYKTSGDALALKKCEHVLKEYEALRLQEFIEKYATAEEKRLIEQELYYLQLFSHHFQTKEAALFFLLQRLKELSFDDVYGGEVTVMGVLESRGMEFDGVIVVDFNEEYVPRVSQSDLFLNSALRKSVGLPTRFDRESLQKHYYYQLFANAKRVAISYVKNEEQMPSRFLQELGIGEGIDFDQVYKYAVIQKDEPKEIAEYKQELSPIEPLYPSSLKRLLECPLRYYFYDVLKIRNEDQEEVLGSLLHEALKESVENKESLQSADDYFEAVMERLRQKITSRSMLYEAVVRYEEPLRIFCQEDFEQMKRSENRVEQRVEFMYEGVWLAAIVDRIDYDGDTIRLIDYKSSKNTQKNESYSYDFQITFYYLYAKAQGYKHIEVVLWDLYEGERLEAKIKEKMLKKVLAALPTLTKRSEDIFIDDKREKSQENICKYCEYKIACGRDNEK